MGNPIEPKPMMLLQRKKWKEWNAEPVGLDREVGNPIEPTPGMAGTEEEVGGVECRVSRIDWGRGTSNTTSGINGCCRREVGSNEN